MNPLQGLKVGDLPGEFDAFASDHSPTMPVNCSSEQEPHRPRNLKQLPAAMIVRQLSEKEIRSMPEALAASEAERKKVGDEDSGRGCRDESKVQEYVSVVETATRNKSKVHMTRLFEIAGIKN